MFESDKFIGIKHVTGGDTFEGCDCLGLVRLFYKEQGWKETFWDGGAPVTHEIAHSKEAWNRLFRYLKKNMRKVKQSKLSYGDVVLFNIDGDMHLGIYQQEGMLLAMSVPVVEGKTKSVLYHRRLWSKAYRGGYRRCNTCQ